jgi:hypothetical protein
VKPTSIRKVLSTFRRCRVRALLMGGQACILYGGAEFSRDIDFAVAVSAGNLARLRRALRRLRAEPIFFPPLSAGALRRGHACHFRCRASGVEGLRIDVMHRMRGADPFGRLWKRRTEVRLPGPGKVAVMSLRDLIRIKKTRRDKDWLMIRRLVEADYARHSGPVGTNDVRFWLAECRTPALLAVLVRAFPLEALEAERPAVRAALRGPAAAERALKREEEAERRRDRVYWRPLRRELERWRLGRRTGPPPRAARGGTGRRRPAPSRMA